MKTEIIITRIKKSYGSGFKLIKYYFFWYFYLLTIKFIINIAEIKLTVESYLGFTWDYFLNSLNVATFIQISMKLLLSVFFIKIKFFSHFIFLFFWLILCLKLNFYIKMKIFLINLVEKTINPFFYDQSLPEDVNSPDIDMEEVLDWNYHKKLVPFYNFNEKILSFLVFFRLCFFCEPFLFNIFKFFLLYFFMYDYNLTLAYLISFIFIFSRFIFFFSDENYNELKKFFVRDFSNVNNVISPKNVKEISHWVLRIVKNHEKIENNPKLRAKDFPLFHYSYLQIVTKINNIKIKEYNKNFVIKLLIIFILFF